MFVIKREILARKKSLIIWSVVSSFLVITMFLKGHTFVIDPQAKEIITSLPKAVIAIYGMSGIDIGNYAGFYAIGFNYFVIMLSIYAVITTTSMFINEDVDHTFEYLLTKPYSKQKLVLNKIFASFIMVTFVNLVTSLVAIFYTLTLNEVDLTQRVILIHLNIYFISLLFMGISLIFVACLKNIKHATRYTNMMIILAYFVYVVNSLKELPTIVKYLSPNIILSSIDVINGSINYFGYVICIMVLAIGAILLMKFFKNKEF